MINKICQVAAKVESPEGTAIALAAADATVRAYDAVFDPDVKFFDIPSFGASLSGAGGRSGQQAAKMSFKVCLAGSGNKVTPPSYGTLLRACGMAETITPLTSVSYAPASASVPSLTMAMYVDGLIKKIRGARGTFKLSQKVGEPVVIQFEFLGILDSITDGALLTAISYETTLAPKFQSAALTLDSYAAILSTLDIDYGNKLTLRDDANAAEGFLSCKITERVVKGNADPEMVLKATYDFLTKMGIDTQFAFTETLGATTGNIITITAPKVQWTGMGSGDRNGIDVVKMGLAFGRNAGDDEIVITQT